MTDNCKTCGHPSHTHGRGPCSVKRVAGPSSTDGRPVFGDTALGKEQVGYEHTGRDVTHCECEAFVTDRNGVQVTA